MILTGFRHLTIAALTGMAVELCLGLRGYVAQGQLYSDHTWLQILQMPGAQIAERVFRYSGLPEALTCVFVVQSAIYGSIIHTVLDICRCSRDVYLARVCVRRIN